MDDLKKDLEKVELKAGLEIHQQLDTHKLFCNCPSVLRSDEPDFIVVRKLHAVAGESGEIDEAVKYASSLNKEFIYQCYNDNVCLVDLDEEPPKEINQEALEIALHISLLLNCEIIPLTQIMRKTVVDGSNTSGFQRTMLIAENGFVETSQGRVGIKGVFLEEDSARPAERNETQVVYKLDRLGIPLVEIATEPDIKTPEQAKETALKIGEILRSCKVRRGIGTIRQDVNMSIKIGKLQGKRVEIKGFQDIRNIEATIEKELSRQIKVVKQGKSVAEVRNALANGETEFLRPMPGSSRMYPETDLSLLKISREKINSSKKSLPRLKQDLEKDLEKIGLSKEMIKVLLKSGKLEDFKELNLIFNNSDLIAKMLLIFPKEIASKEKISLEEVENRINKESLAFILETLKKGNLVEGNVKTVLQRIAKGTDVRDAVLFKKQDFSKVEEFVMKLVKEKPGLNFNAYMGIVMKEFKGINGKEVTDILKKFVE